MTRPNFVKLIPLWVLVGGFVATYFLQQATFNTLRQAQRDYFNYQVREIVLRIEQRLAAYEQVLLGSRGLYIASKEVDRGEFRDYVAALRLAKQYPGIQGVGFSLIIRPHELAGHIEAIRNEGYRSYTVHPAGERDIYTSIVYLEPFADRNLRAFGYDMFSQSVRRTAMERARDLDQSAISGKVTLLQETEQGVQAGFLMYVPVYRGSMHETLAERRANITGWVYSPFRMNDFMDGILGGQIGNVDLEIFDGGEAAPEMLMYDSKSPQRHAGAPLYDFSQCIDVGGRRWHIRMHSLPTLEANIDTARITTIWLTGALVSVLLSLLVWQLINGRARAFSAAQAMTHALRESKEQIDLLLNSVAEGIYGIDTHGVCTFVNSAFLRMLGYGDANEVVGKRIHALIHHSYADGTPYPEDKCRVYRSFRHGEEVHADDEVIWHRDGNPIAVEYWSFPVIREGQVMGAVATFFDITERRRAEDKLRTLSTAIEQSPLSVVITGLEADIQYANPCFLDTTGYSMEEVLGQNPRILQSGQTPKETYLEMWDALTQGQSWHGEFINKRKNGEIYWEEAHIAPVMDSSGKPIHYVAVKLEITRRKKAEEALRESEAISRSIIEASPVPLALNDERGNITYLNRAFMQAIGYTLDDIPTLADWWPCAFPEPQYRQFVAENWQANLEQAKRTGGHFPAMELEIRCKDGAKRTFIVSAAPIRERFAGTHMVILYDITGRKDAERELWNKSQLLDSIIENIPNMIFLKHASDLRFALLNHAGEELLGHGRDEFLGRNDYDFFTKEQADFFAGKDRAALEQQGVVDIPEEPIKTPHGTRILHTKKLALKNVLGEPQYLLGISEDITERKEYETELKRSNIELEQFSYAVSHDMRQPLRMISSYLQLLERSLADQLDNEKRDYFNFAIEGAKRIDQMLVALLEYSRVGRMGEPHTMLDSRALLDEALQFLQPAIDEARASVSITGNWPSILASHDEILRLLQNLIGNAIKYRIAGRALEISVTGEVAENEWRLCVADNGVGIIPSQIKRLFQVFQRLQSREAYEGTGIGLALCRKIAEHHKGRIWAESEGEGRGSRFYVALPMLLGGGGD